ncbi:MAG: o-succinylbenzoate synthase [Rhabdochlamydiaceae bacterium]|jgi:O-succinylbenzoate synthase
MINWHIYSFQIPLVGGGVRKGLILRLIDRCGEEKWGEIAPLPGRSKETFDQALSQLLSLLSTGIVKEELFPSVQFGLENALSFPLPSATAPLYAFLHGQPDEILQRAKIACDTGYTVAKLKISSLTIDVAAHLISALKDRFRLRVDCNSAFSFEEAISLFSRFDPAIFDYIEDPTFEVSRLTDFPFSFALDETVCNYLTLPIQTYSHLYGFILKPTILGGKKGCAPLIEYAQKHNLKVVFSPSFESGLGLLQIVSLANHFNLLSDPLGLDTHRYLQQDLLLPSVNFNTPKLTITAPPQIDTRVLQEVSHGECELPDL